MPGAAHGLYSDFIDLIKTFDTVNTETLWVILKKLGCLRKFPSIVQLFYNNMTGEVLSDSELSEAFSISNGMKQGCALAPILFNLFFTQVLLHAMRIRTSGGIYIRYCIDGSLFDLQSLTAKAKTLRKVGILYPRHLKQL